MALATIAYGNKYQSDGNFRRFLPSNMHPELAAYLTMPTEILAFGTTENGRDLYAQNIVRGQGKSSEPTSKGIRFDD